MAVLVGISLSLASCSSARSPLPQSTPGVEQSPNVALPERSGPVDPRDTGVPAGVSLKPSKGLRITEDDTVVDGMDVDGCVLVEADDVIIRNTRIRCDDRERQLVVQVGDEAQNLVVERSEIDGRGRMAVGIGWSRYTLTNVDVHGVADGARFGHGVLIENSWVHDMARIGSLHSDALQTTSASDVVIRGNVLDPTRGRDGDYNNAALMIGSETGSKLVRDVLVEGNSLDGGNYSLNVRADATVQGLVVRGNVFGDDSRYGPVLAPGAVTLDEDNVTVSGDAVKVVRAKP